MVQYATLYQLQGGSLAAVRRTEYQYYVSGDADAGGQPEGLCRPSRNACLRMAIKEWSNCLLLSG